jgi:hypothetical protein
MYRKLHKMTSRWMQFGMFAALVALSAQVRADSSVALGAAGALERAGQTHDAPKNGTAASFGSPVTDDRRLFKLRWRLPWLVAFGPEGLGFGAAAFSGGFTPVSGVLPGGLALARESTTGASALIPTLAIGEAHKLGQVQLGAVSTSVGHGSLVDRMTNSPEGMPRAAGLALELNLAGLGGQVIVGDFMSPQSFVAGRVYGRPLMWFTAPDATFQPNELDVDPRTEVAGIWVTGVSAVIDGDAPTFDLPRSLWAASWDNEAAVFDNQLVKAIGTLDLNALATKDGAPGLGVHPGAIFMFDFMGARADLMPELNFGTDGYVPRYFDRIYRLERTASLGADKPKLELDRPASWGWQMRAQSSFMKSVTAFAEARDQFPFDPARGAHSAQLTAGASAWLLFMGGSVVASQTGITDYLDPGFFGPGFVVTGEARVGVILNTLHIVGRAWRAHIAAGDSKDDYIVNTGATIGIEANLDLL